MTSPRDASVNRQNANVVRARREEEGSHTMSMIGRLVDDHRQAEERAEAAEREAGDLRERVAELTEENANLRADIDSYEHVLERTEEERDRLARAALSTGEDTE